jgi:hypothetical protein
VDAEQWGGEAESRVCLPAGILIPTEAQGTLWAIKVRLPAGNPKYQYVAGSRRALFGSILLATAEPAEAMIVAEGEFDAMLLCQEAGDLVGVVTLGSASGTIETRWLWELRHARRVLVAYDLDTTGRRSAEGLAAVSRRIRIARPIGAKDLTDMHRAGGDIRAWVRHQLVLSTRKSPGEVSPNVPKTGQ